MHHDSTDVADHRLHVPTRMMLVEDRTEAHTLDCQVEGQHLGTTKARGAYTFTGVRGACLDHGEQVCREFAEQFPTPKVGEAIRHAEAGRITWSQCERLFGLAAGRALTEVTR